MDYNLFVNFKLESLKFASHFKKKLWSNTYFSKQEIPLRPGPYFIKVKIILSLKFKINLIFYLIIEFMKHSFLNFFYEIVNKICIEVKKNWNLKNLQDLKMTNSS